MRVIGMCVCVCHVNKTKVVVVVVEEDKNGKIFPLALRSAKILGRCEIVSKRAEVKPPTFSRGEENLLLPPKTSAEVGRVLGPFIHDYKFIIIPYILPTTTSSSPSSSFSLCSPSSHSVQGSFLEFLVRALTSRRRVCYNVLRSSSLLFLEEPSSGSARREKKKFPSFTSYYYKVYDVRKLPNHIALDSTGVRTQRKRSQSEEYFLREFQ